MAHRIEKTPSLLIRVAEWKKRPPAWFPDREPGRVPLSKQPSNYRRQVTGLEEDFSSLLRTRSLYENNPRILLEIGLLTGEYAFSENLANSFEARWALQFKGFKPVNNGWGTAFFTIEDFERFADSMARDLSQFSDFSDEILDREQLNFRRISLLRYMRFRTSDLKDELSSFLYPSRKIQIKIETTDDATGVDDQITSIASELGLNVYISRSGVVDLEDIHDQGIRVFSDFARKIANIDQVLAIHLDEAISRISNPAEPLPPSVLDVDIATIGANAPIVAVIDTGVFRNTLTSPFLMNDGLDFTGGGDPFNDEDGHGTAVASEIAYGSSVRKYFIDRNVDQLVPVAKIFPVKVLSGTEGHIDYESIFALDGELADAVRRHSIEFINFSITTTVPKTFNDEGFSSYAFVMDRFAKALGVLIVVCTGNVTETQLTDLGMGDAELTFFGKSQELGRLCAYTPSRPENVLNICPPADLLSGLTVGAAFPQGGRYVASSFSKSFHIHGGSFRKPEILSDGGGDVCFDLSGPRPVFSASHTRVPVVMIDETYLCLSYGTSFSAPRVVRALAIARLQYPDFALHTLKGLLLHKASGHKFLDNKRSFDFSGGRLGAEKVKFHSAYGGVGVLPETEEDIFLSDDDYEVTKLIEGDVSSGVAKTFLLPIPKLHGNGSGRKTRDNLVELKLSLTYPPLLSEQYENDLVEANCIHVSAFVHKKDFNPLHVLERKNKKYEDRFYPKNSPEYQANVLVHWTNDHDGFTPPFSVESSQIIKADLLDFLGEDDEIAVTVRAISKEAILDYPFTAIFSVRDLGGVVNIRNEIQLTV